MVLVLSEINCTLLKERLKSGQNYTENQPLGTHEGHMGPRHAFLSLGSQLIRAEYEQNMSGQKLVKT